MSVAKTSPMYSYWHSEQNDEDEIKRLLKLNSNEQVSNLFKYEPYKWENLYQSIINNILSGDNNSIKGLLILLSMLNESEKEITISSLSNLFDHNLINKLRSEDYKNIKSNFDVIRTIRIFFVIFTNPYGLEIRRDKKHIYEKTGYLLYKLRQIFTFN